jgi:hypothetical protein
MNQDSVAPFITSALPALCREDVHGEAGYALPPSSLALLGKCVARLGIQRAFEFGSGQSTQQFLGAGCEVAAVENDESWLASTSASLDSSQRGRFTPFLLPLQRIWLAGAPLQSWVLPDAALAALRDAQLVLVDSPAWPPFREHALILALQHSREALIVVDDANIPTVDRFCQRLVNRNRVAHFQTKMDHGLFFIHASGTRAIDSRRPLMETLKAWRRYFLAQTAR